MIRKFLVTSLLVGVIAVFTAVPASASHVRYRTFWMPSRNVACMFHSATASSSARLECRIGSGLEPEPDKQCDFDWAGADLRPHRRGRPLCVSDMVNTGDNVLEYGQVWRRADMRCASRETGLRCTTSGGSHGFKLSRAKSRFW
jgi:hypothetical protein